MGTRFNFDAVIDRHGTWSLKWDNCKNKAGQPEVIPLWVADMDFAAPPCVQKAIQERAQHPVVGYTNAPSSYFRLLSDWYRDRYALPLGPEEFLLGPAVMPSIAIAIRALVKPEESVIITPPVYYPFFEIVRVNERQLVEVPLLNPAPGQWDYDFDGFEAAITQAAATGHPVRAILLSNPHNPGGRVWNQLELARLDDLALRHQLYLLADEIHSDIVFPPARHLSLADSGFASPGRVVFAGPNKTFNIAGLHICHLIVRDSELRKRLHRAIAAAGFSQPNAFSITAAHAAYSEGAPWLDEMKDYLSANFQFLNEFVAASLPGVTSYTPEGTYLAWLDCRQLIDRLGLQDDAELGSWLEEIGRVKVSHGTIFGKTAGLGFMRINVACPRSQLAEGLQRIAQAIQTRENFFKQAPSKSPV